jgi:hypothetical protein
VLFMVIERFNHGEAEPVGERFRREERILPEGVTYHAGWEDFSRYALLPTDGSAASAIANHLDLPLG